MIYLLLELFTDQKQRNSKRNDEKPETDFLLKLAKMK